MGFAEKLSQLRKQKGWSQEELAEKINVSRQSVSKWEIGQSVPELEKIIILSEIFGVSLDYLLKDNLEEVGDQDINQKKLSLRRVTMEEAKNFIDVKDKTLGRVALGVFMLITSPIVLLILLGLSELGKYNVSENFAVSVGVTVIIVIVAIAIAMLISVGHKTSKFDYLESEVIETEYGVREMVKEKKELFKDEYARNNIIGTVLCIISVIPLVIGALTFEDDGGEILLILPITLLIVGVGVFFFIKGGIIWTSFQKLEQEGDYSEANKESNKTTSSISGIYWAVVFAIFLAYSFITNNWGNSWIIWVVSGVLYPAVLGVIHLYNKNKKDEWS